jgi:cytochrome b
MTDTTISPGTSQGASLRKVKVWDLPTRLFHWSLVTLVVLSFVTGKFGGLNLNIPAGLPGGGTMLANMTVHMWSGYTILALVLFRVIWGLIGSTTARFSNFVRGPAAVIGYLRGLIGRGPSAFVFGHNPAGAGLVVAVLVLLLVQAGSGLFLKEDDFFGIAAPLNGRVSEETAKGLTKLHHLSWALIQLLVILHIIANLYYWLVKKDNLIAAMFSGKKPVPAGVAVPPLSFTPGIVAVLVLAVTAGIVWAIVTYGAA